MKRLVITGLFICVLAVVVSKASSDSGSTPPDTVSGSPGDNNPAFKPFQPYDIGPDAGVAYSDLNPGDRAAADRGRDTTGWAETHNAWREGAVQLAQQAEAEAAAAQLGVENLGARGVVP